MTSHRIRQLHVVLLALLIVSMSTVVVAGNETDRDLTVYFFDVDQGDATLFVGPDFTILVDAGRHDRNDVVPYLQQLHIQSLDLFVGTHPHADHIGQCEGVMQNVSVTEVWLSGDVHTSRTFERCIDAILLSDAGYHEPRAGETFQIGSAFIEIVHPNEITGHFNNGSISMRLTYGDVTFLLTGDAEQEAERIMVNDRRPIQADILHVGHHGSRTSSTLPFLEVVKPSLAIYSAGPDNSYGHPHAEIVQRYAYLNIPLYGTDEYGTITLYTDGSTYQLDVDGNALNEPQALDIPDTCTSEQVNINNASPAELTRLIHVGAVLAERIVEARPFFTLNDLTRVSGLGEQRVADIQQQGIACVGPLQ